MPGKDLTVAENLVNAVSDAAGVREQSEFGSRLAGRIDAENATYNEPGVQTAAILYALGEPDAFESRAERAHGYVVSTARTIHDAPHGDPRQIAGAATGDFGIGGDTTVAEVVERGEGIALDGPPGLVARSDPEEAFTDEVLETFAGAVEETFDHGLDGGSGGHEL